MLAHSRSRALLVLKACSHTPLHPCRPQAMEESQAVWHTRHGDLEGRAQLVAGDFFQSVPAADV